MNADRSLALQASVTRDARQQSTETSRELLRLKAGVPSGPATSTAPKSILLMDPNLRSRESRAKFMRDKGVHVDTVASADAARARMAAQTYNLILVDCGRETKIAESFVQEIRANDSRQLVGFLIGSPMFISKTLSGGTSYRQPARATVATPEKLTPAPEARTFGQRVRDAEAAAGPADSTAARQHTPGPAAEAAITAACKRKCL